MTKSKRMKAYTSFDLYLADQSPKNQKIISELRNLVKWTTPKLRESVKWGNGCWVGEKWPVAYVYSADDYVQLGFMAGWLLKDQKGLLEGAGKYVRYVKVRSLKDIDARAFADLLKQAAITKYRT